MEITGATIWYMIAPVHFLPVKFSYTIMDNIQCCDHNAHLMISAMAITACSVEGKIIKVVIYVVENNVSDNMFKSVYEFPYTVRTKTCSAHKARISLEGLVCKLRKVLQLDMLA